MVSAGRASLAWRVGEGLDVEVSYLRQSMDADAHNTSVGSVPGVGDLQTNFVLAEKVKDKFDLTNLTLSLDLGWATLLSSSSRYQRNRDATSDTSDLGEAIFPTAKLPGSSTFTTEIQDMKSEELRLTSKGDGPFSWIGGVFYVDGRAAVDSSASIAGDAALSDVFALSQLRAQRCMANGSRPGRED